MRKKAFLLAAGSAKRWNGISKHFAELEPLLHPYDNIKRIQRVEP